jgi:hypothetical protein
MPKNQQLIQILRDSGIEVQEKDGAIVLNCASESQVKTARQICEAIGKVFDISGSNN